MRIGQGYDAHQLRPGRKLILGGVTIPWERGLAGHSDADVLTHAVMDALLGAAGLSDIGTLFPDSDAVYKDADSIKLLSETGSHIRKRGFQPVNIDVTLIAQAPSLSPYREEMRQNIAAALQAKISQVNVKFTTEEGMGFTGNREGMAAMAVCLLEECEV